MAISRKMIYSSGLVGRGAPASPRDDEDNNPDTLWVLRRSHWGSFYGTECDDSPWGGVPVDLAEPSTVFRRWRIPKFRSSSRMMSPLIRFFRNTPNGLRRKEFKYREVHLLKGSMAIKYGRGIIRPCTVMTEMGIFWAMMQRLLFDALSFAGSSMGSIVNS